MYQSDMYIAKLSLLSGYREQFNTYYIFKKVYSRFPEKGQQAMQCLKQ